MILILSTSGDLSTDEIIDNLQKRKERYFRLNDNDIFKYDICFKISDQNSLPYFEININDELITSIEINVVWFRKFGFIRDTNIFKNLQKKYGTAFVPQFNSEYSGTLNLICKCLENKKWLSHYSIITPNKFIVLQAAHNVGLRIPESIITNSKKYLTEEIKEKKIAKSISDASFTRTANNEILGMYTFQIDPYIKYTPKMFLSTLIQNEINKDFEIRTFYIDSEFYSMAIFSQNDSLTKTDFRKYNHNKPNRYLPYILEREIEEKIDTLLKKLMINTASVDLIKMKNGEIIFLEINPCGQFGMISKKCNYPLEKIIANKLIDFNHACKKTLSKN